MARCHPSSHAHERSIGCSYTLSSFPVHGVHNRAVIRCGLANSYRDVKNFIEELTTNMVFYMEPRARDTLLTTLGNACIRNT